MGTVRLLLGMAWRVLTTAQVLAMTVYKKESAFPGRIDDVTTGIAETAFQQLRSVAEAVPHRTGAPVTTGLPSSTVTLYGLFSVYSGLFCHLPEFENAYFSTLPPVLRVQTLTMMDEFGNPQGSLRKRAPGGWIPQLSHSLPALFGKIQGLRQYKMEYVAWNAILSRKVENVRSRYEGADISRAIDALLSGTKPPILMSICLFWIGLIKAATRYQPQGNPTLLFERENDYLSELHVSGCQR
ncbi:hypothetical protein EDC04DRAFT_3087636 [Pisolithus marmoratus]|nr:hypothetical protein EDC04DRAFT_3087636 [Pisolithus marmoratus]